jgi:hypothetical protein
MAKPRIYRFEQRSGGRGAVIRVGEKNGQRLIAVYDDQATADEVRAFLEARKGRES